MEDKKISEAESLALITQMISTAKNSFMDTGIGPILWGTVIAICSLVQAAEIHYDLDLPFDIWWLAMLAIIPQLLISVKESRTAKVRGWTDQTINYVWLCFGIGIFIINFISASYIERLNPVLHEYSTLTGKTDLPYFWSYASSFLLFLYGVPTVVTAASRKFQVMLLGGILCWVCSIIGVFTSVKIDFLMMALCAICAWLIPGLIIRRRFLHERKPAHV